MDKNTKGFCLFFDWVERLKELDAKDAFSIIVALSDYFREGTNPVERFSGSLKMAVGMMFDQIKRAEKKSATLRQNALQRWNNSEICNAIAMQTEAIALQTDTTITDTITDTNTNITTTTKIYVFNALTREELVEIYHDIREYFRVEGYVSDAQAFIEYNAERQWRTESGDDTLDNWLKYARAWERKERARLGIDINEDRRRESIL